MRLYALNSAISTEALDDVSQQNAAAVRHFGPLSLQDTIAHRVITAGGGVRAQALKTPDFAHLRLSARLPPLLDEPALAALAAHNFSAADALACEAAPTTSEHLTSEQLVAAVPQALRALRRMLSLCASLGACQGARGAAGRAALPLADQAALASERLGEHADGPAAQAAERPPSEMAWRQAAVNAESWVRLCSAIARRLSIRALPDTSSLAPADAQLVVLLAPARDVDLDPRAARSREEIACVFAWYQSHNGLLLDPRRNPLVSRGEEGALIVNHVGLAMMEQRTANYRKRWCALGVLRKALREVVEEFAGTPAHGALAPVRRCADEADEAWRTTLRRIDASTRQHQQQIRATIAAKRPPQPSWQSLAICFHAACFGETLQ